MKSSFRVIPFRCLRWYDMDASGATAGMYMSDSTIKGVNRVFRIQAGRKKKVNVSINSFCLSFPVWGVMLTIG